MSVPQPESVKVNSWKGVLLGLGLAIISSLGTWFINDQSNKAEERKFQQEQQVELDRRALEVRALEAEKRATQIEIAEEIKKRSEESFEQGVSIYKELYKLLDETNSQRALVLVAHNGGGEMRPGSEKKFDILYEATRGDRTKDIKTKYQNYPYDEGNFRLAADAIQHQDQALYIPNVKDEELLQYSMTQTILDAEGIKALGLKYIGLDSIEKKNMYFLYINYFSTDPHKNTDFIAQNVNFRGRKIRTLINAY